MLLGAKSLQVGGEDAMEYDKDKADDMMLALLYLTSSQNQFGTRAWKGLDVAVLDRLHQKGTLTPRIEKAQRCR